MKRTIKVLVLILSAQIGFSQKITIDTANTYQTMHSFGASDAWSMQMVGENYPLEKREKIAQLLFSNEFDFEGNPKGIGLSMWRFNLGAGSAEQGANSKISNEWRRAECFLENGTYNWHKQKGQQWFLEAAKRYGVDFTLGFLNSAPVSMTKNGLAFGKGKLGEWNFDKTKVDSLSDFITKVANRFKFDYLSPFNEPQWAWGPGTDAGLSSQEGTPINNNDFSWAVRKLDAKFTESNIKTKIVVPEAAMLGYLYKAHSNRRKYCQGNQIEDFFSPLSKNYIGNLTTVEQTVCGHSYFTTFPKFRLTRTRKKLLKKAQKHKINYWQSEYCVLGLSGWKYKGGGQDLGMKTALYVAKVIHADLTLANATAWHWWLAVSANDYKDGLIYLANNGVKGENDQNKSDAEIYDSKTLWALGNYSRFIRPNMQRIKIESSGKKLLVSAYKNRKQIVVVIVNPKKTKSVELTSLPNNSLTDCYTTSKDFNMKCQKLKGNRIDIPGKSVVTLVLKYQ
jgi:hypothetical protein